MYYTVEICDGIYSPWQVDSVWPSLSRAMAHVQQMLNDGKAPWAASEVRICEAAFGSQHAEAFVVDHWDVPMVAASARN